jgi:hypothetical protein
MVGAGCWHTNTNIRAVQGHMGGWDVEWEWEWEWMKEWWEWLRWWLSFHISQQRQW